MTCAYDSSPFDVWHLSGEGVSTAAEENHIKKPVHVSEQTETIGDVVLLVVRRFQIIPHLTTTSDHLNAVWLLLWLLLSRLARLRGEIL